MRLSYERSTLNKTGNSRIENYNCFELQRVVDAVPASEGIAEGRALFHAQRFSFDQTQYVENCDAYTEIERFEQALRLSEKEVFGLFNKSEKLNKQEKEIIQIHIFILQDKTFSNRIKEIISKGFAAEFSLKKVVEEYISYFRSLNKDNFSEQSTIIGDVGRRVLRNIIGDDNPYLTVFNRPTILVASELSPLDLQEVKQPNLTGILLNQGGSTSHAMVLARSLNIPAVIVHENIAVKEGDQILLEGSSGKVFINPPHFIQKKYLSLKQERQFYLSRLKKIKNQKARDKDGTLVFLGANIAHVSETELVHEYGANHIGLFRTEIPFLESNSLPSEEKQFEIFEQVVRNASGKTVTIRTLDLGGDKFCPANEQFREPNPALGCRGIRKSLELEHLLRSQVRAILRCSVLGPVRILIPMVTTVNEIKTFLHLIEKEKKILKDQGYDFDENISIGIMVEVPAVIFILPHILHYIDFVSVGTNDLTQYALATDRNNHKVSHLYDPLHPSVLNMINQVVSICKRSGCLVSICGEAASSFNCIRLFLGMGADELSISPRAIPVVKDYIRQIQIARERDTLQKVLEFEDAAKITSFLEENPSRSFDQ